MWIRFERRKKGVPIEHEHEKSHSSLPRLLSISSTFTKEKLEVVINEQKIQTIITYSDQKKVHYPSLATGSGHRVLESGLWYNIVVSLSRRGRGGGHLCYAVNGISSTQGKFQRVGYPTFSKGTEKCFIATDLEGRGVRGQLGPVYLFHDSLTEVRPSFDNISSIRILILDLSERVNEDLETRPGTQL